MRDFDWSKAPYYKENLAEFDESASQWFGNKLPEGIIATHNKMPEASQIVEFWFRWGNMYCKVYGRDKFMSLPAFVIDLLIDLGEPFCFACRTRYEKWDFVETKKTKKLKGIKALYNHWNTLPLERAHIIPISRNGSNQLRNFVLLCNQCHKEAPDVIDSLFMLRWLQNRKQTITNRYMRDWIEACLQIDFDPFVVMEQKYEIFSKHLDEFKEFQSNFSTNHFDSYSIASEVACIIAFAKQKGIQGKSKFT